MFSALGNILSIKPRQAEQTDTRQAIQRHEQDYEQQRKKKNDKQNQNLNDEPATVSVEALRLFLENFVKNADSGINGQPDAAQSETAPTAPLENEAPNEHTAATSQAAMAASSYQNTAQAGKSNILFETTDQAQGPALDLNAADIRRIYVLIEDLKDLHDANIEYLQIERAATFLDSLVNAAEKAKHAAKTRIP